MSSSAGASITYNAGVTTNPLELLARQHAAEVLIQPLRLSAGRPASVPSVTALQIARRRCRLVGARTGALGRLDDSRGWWQRRGRRRGGLLRCGAGDWATKRSAVWAKAAGALLVFAVFAGAIVIAWLYTRAAYGR